MALNQNASECFLQMCPHVQVETNTVEDSRQDNATLIARNTAFDFMNACTARMLPQIFRKLSNDSL